MSADAIYELVRRVSEVREWYLSPAELRAYADFLATYHNVPPESYEQILTWYHEWHIFVQAIQEPHHPDHEEAYIFLYNYCRTVVRTYREKWSWIRIVDDDDIIQIAATRVWRKINTYRYQSSFTTWSTALIINVIRKIQRQQFNKSNPPNETSLLDDVQLVSPLAETEKLAEYRLFLEELNRNLQQHPDPRLLIILKMYIDGDPKLREIGEQLHVGTTRAYTLLELLRRIIRQSRSDEDEA